MARDKKVSYTAINITLHPHSPKKYIQLFNSLFDMKEQVKLRGDSYAMLTELKFLEGDKTALSGQLGRFTKIDKDEWFNIDEMRSADEDETKKIVIPKSLRANFKPFNFIFYSDSHKLVIEIAHGKNTISPKTVLAFLKHLCSFKKIEEQYGKVELTLIPEADKLKQIFKIPQLTFLQLVITRPNTDGMDDIEEDVLDLLNDIGAREERREYKAAGSSLRLNNQTKALSKVAQTNGSVLAKGRDETGKAVELSTTQHPLIVPGYFNPDLETRFALLIRMGTMVLNVIRTI